MKANHKRKTIAQGKTNYPYLPIIKKHNSTTSSSIEEVMGRVVIFDVIQYVLQKTYQQQRQRNHFLRQSIQKLNRLQIQDSLYFNLDFSEPPQILCKQDIQPSAQENRCLQVKKVKKLNRTSKHKFNNETQETSDVNGSSRTSILEVDKKDRDFIIQKLKKEYSMILQTKYLSESTPIGQSRDVFIQCDETPQINNLRKSFIKKNLKKIQQKHKAGFVENQIRKHNNLKTMFKKSKDFIEIMDPTMSNSIYMSQIQPNNTSHRNSVVNIPPQNQTVNVKLSKFKEITNVLLKPKTEIVLLQKRLSKIQPINVNKMVNIVAQQERQTLKLRVQRSFHSNQKTKFREISQTERKPRVNNSMSVSFLPKIERI